MKSIAPHDLDNFVARHGIADPEWIREIEIPGDERFPTLRLPADKLQYSTARSYPMAFEPRLSTRPLLFVHIDSFDTAAHDASGAGWAIPMAYTPRNADERLRKELGFDEGWEDADHECMFACDERYAGFWRDAVERKRFGLTVPGANALYPVRLGERELEPIMRFLAALVITPPTKKPAARKPAVKPTVKKRSAAAKNATSKKSERKRPAPTKRAPAKKSERKRPAPTKRAPAKRSKQPARRKA